MTVFPDSKHDQIGDYLLKLFERKPRFISGKKFNTIYGFLVKYLAKKYSRMIKFRRKFSSHGTKNEFSTEIYHFRRIFIMKFLSDHTTLKSRDLKWYSVYIYRFWSTYSVIKIGIKRFQFILEAYFGSESHLESVTW